MIAHDAGPDFTACTIFVIYGIHRDRKKRIKVCLAIRRSAYIGLSIVLIKTRFRLETEFFVAGWAKIPLAF